MQFPVFYNERYAMREMTPADTDDMYEYLSDRDFMKYTATTPHTSKDETKKMIEKLSQSFHSGKGVAWAVEDIQSGKTIGNIGLYYLDCHRERAGVGYNIHTLYQNRGIATWALENCIEYAFTTLGVRKIEATCKSPNIASVKVMEKCGMKLQGTRYKSSEKDGIMYDVLVYSISK